MSRMSVLTIQFCAIATRLRIPPLSWCGKLSPKFFHPYGIWLIHLRAD